VSGLGGAKYYIKTFPDAFIDFFNVWGTFKSLFGKKKGTEFDILTDFTGCVRPGEVSVVFAMLISDVTCSRRTGQWMYHVPASNGESEKWLYKYKGERRVRRH